MSGATSAYVRYPFTADHLESLKTLSLQIRYEDGFVAYLNGVEVARRNAPATVRFDATASANQNLDSANQYEEINLSQAIAQLVEGENVLAVHGFNDSGTNTEFLIDAHLVGVDLASAENVGFATDPTPGRTNGFMYRDLVQSTAFSQTRGFYNEPFILELTTPGTSEAAIYFTRTAANRRRRIP